VHSRSCELEREITPNCLEVHQRVSLTPDLHFGTWFQWISDPYPWRSISWLVTASEGHIVLGRHHISARGELDLPYILVQLEEAFGSLDIHLYLVSWRHCHPYTLFLICIPNLLHFV
jgi:hypothetical protein